MHPDPPPEHGPGTSQTEADAARAAPDQSAETAVVAEEITLMATAAKHVVDAFDFHAARRFIESRARQVRGEIRVYALSITVLAVAGIAQHVARKPGAIGSLDRTDGLMLFLGIIFAAAALGRVRVLTSVGSAAGRESPDTLRASAGREAARVRRERVTGAASAVIGTLALALAAVDAALDRDWVFTAAFAVLAAGCGAAAGRLIGRRAQSRAERFIAGQMDEAAYLRGHDGDGA